MAPFFVVTLQAFYGDLSHLIHRLKHIGSEHFSSIGPIIALDEGLLIRFPQLNITQLDPPLWTPGDEALCEKLRASVEANRLGWPRQVSTRTTHWAGNDVSTSMAKLSRTSSSRIFKVPNRRPP